MLRRGYCHRQLGLSPTEDSLGCHVDKYHSKERGSRRMYSLTPVSQELRLLLGQLNPQLLDSLTQS